MLKRPSFAVNPSGAFLAREAGFASIAIWPLDGDASEPLGEIPAPGAGVAGLHFSAERELWVLSKDGDLHAWDLAPLFAAPPAAAHVPVASAPAAPAEAEVADAPTADESSGGGGGAGEAESAATEQAAPEEPPSPEVVDDASPASTSPRSRVAAPKWSVRLNGDVTVVCSFEAVLAAGGARGQVWLVEPTPESATVHEGSERHLDAVVALAFSPDGRSLASSGRDRLIRIWRKEAPSRAAEAPPVEPSDAGEEGPDAEELPDAAQPLLPAFTVVRRLHGLEGWQLALAFSPDATRLVSGGIDQGLYLWDLSGAADTAAYVQFAHAGWVVDVAWSQDGETIASASWDTRIGLFDGRTLEPQVALELHRDYVADVEFVGPQLVAASHDSDVSVWRWRDRVLDFVLAGHTDWVQAVAPLGGGRVLTIASDRTARVWNLEDGAGLGVAGPRDALAGFELGAPVDMSEYVELAGLASQTVERQETRRRYRDYRASGFRGTSEQTALGLLEGVLPPDLHAPLPEPPPWAGGTPEADGGRALPPQEAPAPPGASASSEEVSPEGTPALADTRRDDLDPTPPSMRPEAPATVPPDAAPAEPAEVSSPRPEAPATVPADAAPAEPAEVSSPRPAAPATVPPDAAPAEPAEVSLPRPEAPATVPPDAAPAEPAEVSSLRPEAPATVPPDAAPSEPAEVSSPPSPDQPPAAAPPERRPAEPAVVPPSRRAEEPGVAAPQPLPAESAAVTPSAPGQGFASPGQARPPADEAPRSAAGESTSSEVRTGPGEDVARMWRREPSIGTSSIRRLPPVGAQEPPTLMGDQVVASFDAGASMEAAITMGLGDEPSERFETPVEPASVEAIAEPPSIEVGEFNLGAEVSAAEVDEPPSREVTHVDPDVLRSDAWVRPRIDFVADAERMSAPVDEAWDALEEVVAAVESPPLEETTAELPAPEMVELRAHVADAESRQIWERLPNRNAARQDVLIRRATPGAMRFGYSHRIKTPHHYVYGVAVSNGGDRIATCGGDNSVCIWSRQGELLYRMRTKADGLNAVAFSADGRAVVAGGDDAIVHLWLMPPHDDRSVPIEHAELRGHDGWISSVAFSPDESFVLTGSYDGTTRVWKLATGQCVRTLPTDAAVVSGVAIGIDRAYAVDHGGQLRVWDQNWNEIDRVPGHDKLLGVSSDGRVTAYCAANGEVFALRDGRPMPLMRHRGEARGVCVRGDGAIFSVGSDKALRIYQPGTDHPAQSLSALGTLWCVDATRDICAAGADDGNVYVFGEAGR